MQRHAAGCGVEQIDDDVKEEPRQRPVRATTAKNRTRLHFAFLSFKKFYRNYHFFSLFSDLARSSVMKTRGVIHHERLDLLSSDGGTRKSEGRVDFDFWPMFAHTVPGGHLAPDDNIQSDDEGWGKTNQREDDSDSDFNDGDAGIKRAKKKSTPAQTKKRKLLYWIVMMPMLDRKHPWSIKNSSRLFFSF